MMSFEMNDRKKIGLGLTAFGIFFSFLGVVLFFDKGLLAMGNILFVSGVMLTIGLKSSMQFFMKPSNFKGTISFGAGFFLVVVGWPVFGMILEAYGFLVLFRFTASLIYFWLLAHSGSFYPEDSCPWMGGSTSVYQIILGWLPW